MEHTFMTALKINKVRHLVDIDIPLSCAIRKNLLLTGKNGSGKTSVLISLASFLEYVISNNFSLKSDIEKSISFWQGKINQKDTSEKGKQEIEKARKNIANYQRDLNFWTDGCVASCSSLYLLREKYQRGEFILAFYGDSRKINVSEYKNIEKIDLKPIYKMEDRPSKDLGKYLVNLKSTQAFAQAKQDYSRAQEIEAWFDRFTNILRRIYQNDSLTLDFNIDTFQFSILLDGKEPFSFNTMSMGYAAIFDIVSDLLLRMEAHHRYDLEGIVLIDEVETHLHVELQKEIVPILTELFPNLQFIITTHSPFVLSSAQNAVVYDLENRTLVEDGLTSLPYEGIVEGYFNVDLLSKELREKFDQYKYLVQKQELTDSDYAQIAELEYYLNEIPDYLAVDFAEAYARLKTEFNLRG